MAPCIGRSKCAAAVCCLIAEAPAADLHALLLKSNFKMISCRAGQLTMRVLLRPAAMISAQSMASLQCKGAAELVGSAVVPELSDRFGTAPATPTQARFSSFFQQTFATLAVLPAKKASGALPCTLQLTSARPIENSYRALGEAARYFAKDAIPQAEAGGLEALKEHANHAPENSKPTAENLDPAGLLKVWMHL